jgi:hypothetical protein
MAGKVLEFVTERIMAKKEYAGKIRVDAKIEALIPLLNEDQLAILEESLIAEGRALSSLWLWGDLLVDGHNRFRLCKQHKLPYEVTQVYEDAEDIEDVMDRIRRDSLARRHMTPLEQSKIRAERVAYKVGKGSKLSDAVRIVAEQSNVSVRNVYRDVERAGLVESVDEEAKPAAETMSTPALKKLAAMTKKRQQAVAKKAGGDGKVAGKEVRKSTSKEKGSAASLFVAMQKSHFSGKTGLPQTIDAMADANGGRGAQYDIANAAIDTFLKATAGMRDGKL